jgi:Caspase domain
MLRDIRFLLKTKYSGSRALIIGIDDYALAQPLSYAVSDAQAVRDVLVSDLGFPEDGVVCLFDSAATKTAILQAYMRFAVDSVDVDERVVVFFAGHGYTATGYRGEIGYLVPVDADPGDLASLIRWDELTGNSELIRAKHVLFVMDACYGGLMLTRALSAGSTRFLKDMLLRYSRQVLTAGKADEIVADSGGPIPNHSVFTGHLIQGLQGRAVGEDGILTASGLMAYVYGKVAKDKNSRQTPHYGHFDGDGDMILLAPQLDAVEAEITMDVDTLIVVPVAEGDHSPDTTQGKIDRVKSLLASISASIELHDFVMNEVRALLAETNEDAFAISGIYTDEELLERISRYEEVASDLSIVLACIAYWAQPSHEIVLQKALARSIDRLELQGGLSAWLALRWYPAVLEIYSSGIAAVQGRRYDSLASIFLTSAGTSEHGSDERYFMGAMSKAILGLNRMDAFKRIPGHERHFTPMSEYLFKILQPPLDNALFVGADYERAFDEFEVLFALSVVDLRMQRNEHVWAPTGRFGWKQQHGKGPLAIVMDEARAAEEDWAPLRAGLFGGKAERFKAAAEPYLERVSNLQWW